MSLLRSFKGVGLGARVARASVGSIFLKVLSTILGSATTIVLARYLGADNYGVYAFAVACVMVVGLPVKAGLPQLVVRETAYGLANEDLSTVKGIWRWATVVVILVSLILAVVAFFAIIFGADISGEQGRTIAIGMLLVPLMGLALACSSPLRGIGLTIQGQLPELLVKPLAMLLLILTVVFVSSISLTATHAMSINVLATLVALLIGVTLLHRARPPALKQVHATYQTGIWLRTLMPLAAINAMHLINTQADIILLGIFVESSDVGHYKVAAQVSLIVAFGAQATKTVVEPYIARFYREGDSGRLVRLIKGAARLNFLAALSVFAALLIFGKELLGLAFGPAFTAALVPMLILSGGRLMGSIISTGGALLTMAGYHKEYARFWSFAALANIALNVALIPTFGTIGAATSTAITLFLANGLGWWSAKKWLGFDCSPLPSHN